MTLFKSIMDCTSSTSSSRFVNSLPSSRRFSNRILMSLSLVDLRPNTKIKHLKWSILNSSNLKSLHWRLTRLSYCLKSSFSDFVSRRHLYLRLTCVSVLPIIFESCLRVYSKLMYFGCFGNTQFLKRSWMWSDISLSTEVQFILIVQSAGFSLRDVSVSIVSRLKY